MFICAYKSRCLQRVEESDSLELELQALLSCPLQCWEPEFRSAAGAGDTFNHCTTTAPAPIDNVLKLFTNYQLELQKKVIKKGGCVWIWTK